MLVRLGVLLLLVTGPLPATSITYAFQSDNVRLNYVSPFLIPEDYGFVTPPPQPVSVCSLNGFACPSLAFSTMPPYNRYAHQIYFGDGHDTLLPDGTLSNFGAALSIGGTHIGRAAVYRSLDSDETFEYYFKDATGNRTFRFRTRDLIIGDGFLTGATCTATPGTTCGTPFMNTDLFGQDVLGFDENGYSWGYVFPQLAFSQIGIHETLPGDFGGTLKISIVRADPIPPTEVPEPSTVLLTIAALALIFGVRPASAATVTYAFESPNARFEYDAPGLLPINIGRQNIPLSNVNFCFLNGQTCPFLALIPNSTPSDQILFGPNNDTYLPRGSLAQIGAAFSLTGVHLGRLAVYDTLGPGKAFEYYFKDSTGTRTFRYQTPRLLLRDSTLTGATCTGCSSAPSLDMDVFGQDALIFNENGNPWGYVFDQFAFSTIGIHQTAGGAFSGTLAVSVVRVDPPDTAEVPEPSTILLTVAALAMIFGARPARAAPVTYAFESAKSRLQYDAPNLIPPDGIRQFASLSDGDVCTTNNGPCIYLALSPGVILDNTPLDALSFGPNHITILPNASLSQTGAAMSLGGLDMGRFAVYETLGPDKAYEYYFKDSTGNRTFRWLTQRLLLRDNTLTGAVCSTCSSAPVLDMDSFGQDVLIFNEAGNAWGYIFPQLAFSAVGIYQTDGGALSGQLSISVVRVDPLEATEVPEPSTILLTLAALALIFATRIARVYQTAGQLLAHDARPLVTEVPKRSAILLIIATLGLILGASPAQATPVTYAFESPTSRFEYDAPGLITQRYAVVERRNLNFCSLDGQTCPAFLTFVPDAAENGISYSGIGIGGDRYSYFAPGSISQTGASLSITGTEMGRLAVYRTLGPDEAYEYYFKDSTGNRTFRFQSRRMLARDTTLTGADCTLCSSAPVFDMDTFGQDVLLFNENGSPWGYIFPQLAFSTLGIHQTDGGALSGTLRVSIQRADLATEVPEPSTILLTLAAIGLLFGARPARAATITYAFEGSNNTRFEYDRPDLLPNSGQHSVSAADMNVCLFQGASCTSVTLAPDLPGPIDGFYFGPPHSTPVYFPAMTLAKPGSSMTLPNSPVYGRMAVYELPGRNQAFEYHFTDAANNRSFRFQTPRLLLRDADLNGASCTVDPSSTCGTPQMRMSIAGQDAISFTENGLPWAYFFEETAFSEIGLHRTVGGAFPATLRVGIVNLPPPPRDDVPEPAAILLTGGGCALLLLLRRR